MPPKRRQILIALIALALIYTLLPSSSSSSSNPTPSPEDAPSNLRQTFVPSSPPRNRPPLDPIPNKKDRPPLRPLKRPSANNARTPSPAIHLSTFLPSSRLPSSIKGYNVFTNLYLLNGRLIFAPSSLDDDSFERFELADVVTLKGSLEVIEPVAVEEWWEDTSGEGDRKTVEVFKGDTLVFNDRSGEAGYLVFHDNFASEAFLGGLKALSRAPPSSLPPSLSPSSRTLSSSTDVTDIDIQRIAFPHAGDNPFPLGWKDERSQNEKLIRYAAPHATIVNSTDWASTKPKLLERVTIVDRRAAHRHDDTHRWAKMAAHMAVQPSPVRDWFALYRKEAIETYGLEIKPMTEKPVVIYVDRNKNLERPRLSTSSHLALVKALRTIASKAEVHVTVFSNMLLPEKIEVLSRATIIISASTPDLKDVMWMPAVGKSTVIELMDPESFIRDHELLCEMIGHSHVLIRKDSILPKESWLSMKPVRSPTFYDEIEVNPAVVVNQVRTILGLS